MHVFERRHAGRQLKTALERALGITVAANSHGMPVAISLTLKTDGRLPAGDARAEAIQQTDAKTGRLAPRWRRDA